MDTSKRKYRMREKENGYGWGRRNSFCLWNYEYNQIDDPASIEVELKITRQK
jgi:hypothetical protein